MKWFIKLYILLFLVITHGEASHRAVDVLVTSSRCFTQRLHFYPSFRKLTLFNMSYPLMDRGKKSSSPPLILPRSFTPSTSSEFIDIVHPCSDFGFKRAFGDPEVASGFLNTILTLSGDDSIQELLYVDKELSSRVPEGKDFRVDVLCRTQKGEWFLLEMQNDYRKDYPDKAFVEFCRLFGNLDSAQRQPCSNPLDHGQESRSHSVIHPTMIPDFWKSVPRVIALVITNKEFGGRTKKGPPFRQDLAMEPDVVNTYTMRHTSKTHQDRRLGNIDARIVLITLANFHKKETELGTDLDRWLFALKDEKLQGGSVGVIDAYKHVRSIDNQAAISSSIKRFYQILNKDSIGGEQLREYEESIATLNSTLSARYGDGYFDGSVSAYHATGKSIAEIAELLTVSEDQVRLSLEKKTKETNVK